MNFLISLIALFVLTGIEAQFQGNGGFPPRFGGRPPPRGGGFRGPPPRGGPGGFRGDPNGFQGGQNGFQGGQNGFQGGRGGGPQGGGPMGRSYQSVNLPRTNTGNIETIVGCNHRRNTNQPTRSIPASIACEQLLQHARKIASGQTSCQNAINGFGMGPPTCFSGCRSQGESQTISCSGPGKRKKRQGPMGGGCSWRSGYNIQSVYTEEIIGNYRVIATNGIPDHNYDQKTPNTPCETYRIMVIPNGKTNSPPRGRAVDTPMGEIGIAKSGAFIFNHKSGEPVCRVAAVAERESFGSCFGHAQQNGFWHYHAPSRCLTQSSLSIMTQEEGRDPTVVVGYLADGYPLRDADSSKKSCYRVRPDKTLSCKVTVMGRGPGGYRTQTVFPGCDTEDYYFDSSKPGCSLDESSGATDRNGKYSYFMTDATDPREAYPYINAKWHYSSGAGYLCAISSASEVQG